MAKPLLVNIAFSTFELLAAYSIDLRFTNCSDTLRILRRPDLSQIEEQVLIFNITKYNESDSINLIKENGNIIEFVKK